MKLITIAADILTLKISIINLKTDLPLLWAWLSVIFCVSAAAQWQERNNKWAGICWAAIQSSSLACVLADGSIMFAGAAVVSGPRVCWNLAGPGAARACRFCISFFSSQVVFPRAQLGDTWQVSATLLFAAHPAAHQRLPAQGWRVKSAYVCILLYVLGGCAPHRLEN